VHLDIAGPARASADDGELARGGTGFGVRTLVELARTFEPPQPKKSRTKKSGTKKKATTTKAARR
jgi:leucyl aminopeptidase